MDNAIILCSGGLDSVVLAHYLKKVKKIEKIILVFLDYNQKSLNEELSCVKKVAQELNADLKVIDVKWLGNISTSFINKPADEGAIGNMEDLISWYVPCRNALFGLIGLSLAEGEFISKNEKYDTYLGIKYEGELQFKDTTPEFIEQMNKTAEFCTQEGNFKFIAPFLNKDKEELIELAKELDVDLKATYSCYIGGRTHCGKCSACKSRKKAFKFSNITDPTNYRT